MAAEAWHESRLIPVSGIKGAQEQERRATSALLAVMAAVTEFGRAVTKPLGAPAGKLETFIEVPFEVGETTLFPDGLIRVTRGKTSWVALVEVKTGSNVLGVEQVESYLDICRDQGFDAVITISNQIPPAPGVHPVTVNKRKIRKAALHHMSWTKMLTEAVLQKEFRGVADPDQAWILGELIRYLEYPKSGAMEFSDMGPTWVATRSSVKAGTLRPSDKGLSEVVTRFEALMRFLGLTLGRQLGTEVIQGLSRKEMADSTLRVQALVASLTEAGRMEGSLKIPGTVGDLQITVDLRANTVTTAVDIGAPGTGRPRTRINWLVRQLRKAPDSVRIETFVHRGRGVEAADLLGVVRENPDVLVADSAKEIKSFRVAMVRPLGVKQGRGRGCFIDSLIDSADDFYGDVCSTSRPGPQLLPGCGRSR